MLPQDVTPNTTICYVLIARIEWNGIESGFEHIRSRCT